MILTEEEAKTKFCIPQLTGLLRPHPQMMEAGLPVCLGSQCMAHWKWTDATHTEGYCSIDLNANDKPKVK